MRANRGINRSANCGNNSRGNKCRFELLERREMMAFSPLAGVMGELATAAEIAPPPPPGFVSVVNEFNFNSKPGAPAKLFLDFSGHVQKETVGDWHGIGGWGNIVTPAYDRDGDPTRFSPEEQQQIRFIWASVAEDYAPFNINVTTVDPDPGLYHVNGAHLRVVVSGGKDDITGQNLEGFSEIGAYAREGGANVAYVFNRNTQNQLLPIKFIANSAAHEAGHSFGLEDQSQFNKYNAKVQQYRPGNGERAPIMGQVKSAERGTWAKGPVGPGVTNFGTFSTGFVKTQDDMAIIARSANGFGYRTDDNGNTFAYARQLGTNTAGLFGRGIIEKTSDIDMFKFTTAGGAVGFKLQVPQERFLGTAMHSIGNLNATLKLYNSAGTLIAEDSDPGLSGNLAANVGAGTYYVRVGSVGAYGDVGQYTLQETSGPQVVASQYTSLSPTQGSLLVTFSEAISIMTFTAQDVQLNSAAAGAGVISIGAAG